MQRREAVPVARRRFLRECEEGDGVRFLTGKPQQRASGEYSQAPSDIARLMFWVDDTPFVRFLMQVGGKLGDPVAVDPNLAIEVLPSPPWPANGGH